MSWEACRKPIGGTDCELTATPEVGYMFLSGTFLWVVCGCRGTLEHHAVFFQNASICLILCDDYSARRVGLGSKSGFFTH